MSGPATEACWDRIGGGGDRSCPELPTHVHCRNCGRFEAGGRALLDREPPPEYLAAWAGRLAAPPVLDPLRREAVVVFRVGAAWLALPAGVFVEVATPRPIRPVPHRTRGILLGLAAVRGEVLACASLERLLGPPGAPPPPAAPPSRLAVVRWEGRLWAFPVAEVLGVHRFHRSELEETPEAGGEGATPLLEAYLSHGGRRVGLLDPERLFSALARGTA